MKQISLFFLNKTKLLQPLCEHHRSQEKEYSTLWQQLNSEQKKKILHAVFRKEQGEVIVDYFTPLEIDSAILPMVTLDYNEEERIKQWS